MTKKMFKKIKNKISEVNRDMGIDSRSREVYGVTALFETPDEIMYAAGETVKAGYEKFDVNTPYPVHGMDDVMKLKRTKLGYATFIFGSLGTITALVMIWFMSGFDYKNLIGGKPFFSVTPSIPIAFELTVLLGAVFTIIFTLFIFNKLPKINHPLMDTDYMKRVSSDKYGVVILAEDKKFDVAKVKAFFESIGGKDVTIVYEFQYDELSARKAIFNPKFIMLMIAAAIVTAGITYVSLNVMLNYQPFNWMQRQFKVNAQTENKFYSDSRGMREPVSGTVSRNWKNYYTQGSPDSSLIQLSNPLPVNKQTLELGKQKFETFCSPCHGYYARGDSRLNGQFPNPPTLLSDKVMNWKDGNIYFVIVNGQNIMPSYAKQTSDDERWAIIHYIRALQRAQNAKDTDFPADTTAVKK